MKELMKRIGIIFKNTSIWLILAICNWPSYCIVVHLLKGSSKQTLAVIIPCTIACIILWVVAIVKNNNKLKLNEAAIEPYSFDYSCELEIYVSVGKKKARYEKYSQWKKHIEEEYQIQIHSDDFYHFIRRRFRIKENKYDMIKALLVPVEVALIAVFAQDKSMIGNISYGTVYAFITALIIVVLATNEMISCKNEIHFLNDMIELINKTQGGD